MGTLGIVGICGCVAAAGYWYHAGDELGYPQWLGAVVGWLSFFGMVVWWPRSLLWAIAAQVGAVVLVTLLRRTDLRTRS